MATLTSQGYGDFVMLGGSRSAGLADVSGASSPRKWDQAAGYGLSGATTRFLGVMCSEFSIKFRLYGDPQTPSPDWAAWNAFEAAVLMKPPGGSHPKALDIWHPVLERLKIKSVGVKDVGQPYQSDTGEWTIEVQFIEFRRPKIALAKPEGSKAAPSETDAQRTVRYLDGQIQEAAKG